MLQSVKPSTKTAYSLVSDNLQDNQHNTLSGRLPLWIQLMFALLISLTLTSFLTAFAVRQLETSVWKAELEERSQNTLNMMAAAVVEAVIISDRPVLETFVEQTTLHDPDIAALRLTDESGAILADWKQDFVLNDEALISYAKPIIVEGETFGAIEIEWSTHRFQRRVNGQVRRMLGLTTGLLLLLTILIYLSVRWLTLRPVNQIYRRLQRASEGDYDADTHVVASVELVRLNDAVGTLATTLQERQAREEELEATRAALLEERSLMRAIMVNWPDPIYVKDLQGRLMLANPAHLSMLGRSELADVVGKTDFQLMDSKLAAVNISSDQAVLQRDEPLFDIEYMAYDADQEPVWLSASKVPLRDHDGQVRGLIGLNRVITIQKKAEQSLAAVLDAVGEGIITLDVGGHILTANQEISRIFGYQPGELDNHHLLELLALEYSEHGPGEEAGGLGLDLENRLRERIEVIGLRKDGNDFPLELKTTVAQLGDRPLYTVSMRDITESKELENLRDDFVATISHELRTPLASVMGWTETLLSERPGPLTDIQKRFLKIIYDSSQRLDSLIEEIMIVSDLQIGQLNLSLGPVWPDDLINGVLVEMQPLLQSRSIGIELQNSWPADRELVGDSGRLEQVLTNLIGNAVKFSAEGQAIWIRSFEQDQEWRVEITDSGMGIADADSANVFQRFFRADNAKDAAIQGAGLGLFVSKAIVEAHRGTIGLDSDLGQGTTAWFQIPLF